MTSLQRMIHYLKPYTWIVIFGIITVILPVAMELVVPRMLQVIIDQGIRAGNMDAIWRGSGVMFVAAIVGAIATLGQGVFRAQLSQGLAYDMRSDLFTHIQSFSFANLDQLQTGQLMTRVSSDVDVVRRFTSAGLSLMLRAALMIVGSVILLLQTDWQLTIIMFVILAIAAGMMRFIIKTAQPLFKVVQQKLAALNTLVQENLAGVQVVKAFVREPFEINRFEDRNVDYMDQNIKVGRLMAVALPVLVLLTNLGLVAVIWFGGLSVIEARLTIGELVAFNTYLMIGITPLMLLSNMLTMVARAEASAGRILEVLGTEPSVQAIPAAYQGQMKGYVAFDHVSFHYGGKGQNADGDPVLNEVSFEVKPGQQIALFGETGSGKSTLINLMPRFYDVDEGAIRIDDVNVRDWDVESLRAQISVVMQQTILFSGTVRENISYGRPQASDEEVIAAAKAAQAHAFIMAMPEGYDSTVEAKGANLSGGQRQRVAIARALLVSPSILILDDSTSAVDMETEYKIQQALDHLMAGRTTFIIAQRITSVLNADQIIILDRGRIAAQGTHHELLRTSPIYQEIYDSQLGEHHPVETAFEQAVPSAAGR